MKIHVGSDPETQEIYDMLNNENKNRITAYILLLRFMELTNDVVMKVINDEYQSRLKVGIIEPGVHDYYLNALLERMRSYSERYRAPEL